MIRRYSAMLLLLVSVWASSAHAGPKSDRIESISPEAALPGAQVTITGRGFGGPNVRVTVAGAPARIVAANGHRVTFVVPGQVPAGPAVVTAMNPGGRIGSIAFTVLSPRPHAIAPDVSRTATVSVSELGGAVTAQAASGATFRLEVPAAAVSSPTTISVTPVRAVANLPLTGELAFGVVLQPAGLRFDRPATLTITLPAGTDPSDLFGFLFDDSGGNFEILRVTASGTTLSMQVPHFSVAGAAQGTLEDFAGNVQPLLDALPLNLPPTQVTGLVTQLHEWLDRFGTDLCAQTTLCDQVVEIANQSIELHRDAAIATAGDRVRQEDPFGAYSVLQGVVSLATQLAAVGDLAEELRFPGFDDMPDVSVLGPTFVSIIDLAKTQALANPRVGLFALFIDLMSDAALLGLEQALGHARSQLADLLEELLERGRNRCETDPDAGEALLNLLRTAGLDRQTLDAISTGLPNRLDEAWAGCRIVITPANPTVVRGKQLQLTATAVGMDPGFIWTLAHPGVGGSIDPTSGLYTAGNVAHGFYARATSTSDPARYKGVTIAVIEVGVQVEPATVAVDAGATVSFTATVTNTTNTAVTWSVFNGGGTIDQQGTFTAGTTPGTYTVIATSVDDPLSLAFSTVTIRPVPVLQGRVTARMELHGAVTSTVEEWTVDLQVRNGTLVATGTFSVTETASFECGPITTRTAGTITSARFVPSSDPSQVFLHVEQAGERTRSGCGETTGPEAVGPMSGNTFFGTATHQNGRIVAIDFTYSESYNFPGSTGSYTQTGVLVER